ncbi:MAG: GAF domain-containing protein, partial [candidate division Zixibacteria bacterium]|nr:GAF domain-containing protein [candidate division Zixibacteria bacterium]
MSVRHLRGNVPLGFRELLHEMLSHSVRDYSRSEMLKRICASLLRFSGSDVLSIRIDENGGTTRCRATINPDGTDHVEIFNSREGSAPGSSAAQDPISEPILEAILSGSFSAAAQSFTTGRSFWTSDSARPILLHKEPEADPANRTVVIGGEFASLAVVLIPLSNKSRGVLFLASRRHDFFTKEDIQAYEAIAETLGFALDHQGTQWALRERVKELTCLYGIASVAGRPGLGLDEFLTEIVELLPPGWQYPEMTTARITLGGREYPSRGFKAGPQSQSADIGVADQQRGTIEVFYSQRMPEAFEGPFLQEERHLLNAIAEMISRRIAHHEAQWALRERVKELTCLYGIAQAASRHPFHLDRFFEEVYRLLPPGWQYPGITEARVTFDGRSYATPGWQKS